MQADSAESLCLALGTEQSTTGVKTLKGTVVVRVNPTARRQHERQRRSFDDREEPRLIGPLRRFQRNLVDGQALNCEINTPQKEWSTSGLRLQLQPAANNNMIRLDINVEFNGREAEGPRRVIR